MTDESIKCERDPFFYWHSQNLNDRVGGTRGSMWQHGRAWWRFGRLNLRAEWVVGSKAFRLACDLSRDDDDAVCLSWAIPPFALYFGVNHPRLRRWMPREDREIRIAIFDWTLWINPWSKSMEWNSADPWYVKGLTFHFRDFLLGKPRYSSRVLRETPISVALDGRTYDGTCKIELAEWRRARWFTLRVLRADMDIPEGIPIPGKGENSWDCGEDRTYGMTCPARDEHEAVAKLIESTLRTRGDRGGRSWQPEALRVSPALTTEPQPS